MKLLDSTFLSRAPRLAQRLFEGRMLIISPADSMLHRLDETGTFIWEQLETPQTLGVLLDRLDAHYNGFDRAAQAEEVFDFVKSMVEKKLMVAVE